MTHPSDKRAWRCSVKPRLLTLLVLASWGAVQAADSLTPEPISRVEVKAMASKRSPA